MSVFVQYGRICNYTDTVTVSGNGAFTFDYLYPYLYVVDEGAAGAGVFKIYDITDPANPALKSTQNTGASTKPRNPKFYRHPNGTPLCLIPYTQSKQLAIWDCTDPTAPSLLGTCNLSFKPYGVDAIGFNACVCYFENFLQTKSAERVDISAPASPVLTGSWSASKLASAVLASNDTFFLTGENSSSGPTFIASIRASDFALLDSDTHGGAFAGLDQYIALNRAFTKAYTTNDGNGAIGVWDISDPSNLTLLGNTGSLFPAGSGPVIALLEDQKRLYLGRGGGGGLEIYILDVTNDAAITVAGNINTSGETVTDIAAMNDGCPGIVYAQGTGAAIHLVGIAPQS